jgi:CBS domain-containing protein
VRESPYPFAVVLSTNRVVLGRVPASHCQGDADQPVEQVMDPGPKTVRPHRTAETIAHDLAERDLRWTLVTTPEGELIGIVSRIDLEAAAQDAAISQR